MIKLSGLLTIRTISGRNGPFNVGRLVTDLGEFTVKDSTIEEYDEGRYEGDFGIAGIHPAHYLAGGRLIVEVRARLASIALAGIDDLTPEDQETQSEPDPIDEPAQAAAGEPQLGEAATAIEAEADAGGDDSAALFGELAPLGHKVKLDPTVDRAVFRRQRDTLKRLGYRFEPLGQAWVNTSVSPQAEPSEQHEAETETQVEVEA